MRIVTALAAAVAATISLARGATNDPLAGVPGATITITPGGDIYASTYNTGSFVVTNTSGGPIRLTKLLVDLTTALFPDLVFDPNGTAGDTVAKCFTADSGAVGLIAPADPCATPFGGPHDGGYDTLKIDFLAFSAAHTFQFSVDVDPTTIKGATAPGPNQSGSVSGLELTGATITATFSDGSVLTGYCFRVPGSDGACTATLSGNMPAAPGLVVLGAPASPATVIAPGWTARVSGPANAQVALLQVEAGLFTAGLAGGGFDIDPYEANSAISVTEYDATIGLSGTVDIPITLTRSDPDGGLNHLVAVLKTPSGITGPLSPILRLDLDDCTAPPERSSRLDLDPTNNLAWTPLPGALTYDVVEGDLDVLHATGSLTQSVDACLTSAESGLTAPAPGLPAPGHGYFYLVRGRGCGGVGTWDDETGTSQSAPRDAAIDAATASCP